MDARILAVVTTGIFCAPGCPARPPKPENIRYFATCREALSAGFRPCKRCKPMGNGQDLHVILRACAELSAEGSTVAAVAAAVSCSESRLRKLFLDLLGATPRAFQKSVRLNSWKRSIRTSKGPLDAAFAAGYGSARGLYEGIGERLGMTPARFARGGKGMTLAYETLPHEMGTILVAGTDKGVSFVAIGEELDPMLAELRHDYPEAEIQPLTSGARWTPAVLRALDQPSAANEIPLDVQATAFQARVWQALKEIPPGETRTYSGLAAHLGNPAATRAVARACATNRVSILIPCHRVVGVSGDLTGYRWGKERKAALLDRERRGAAFTLS